MILKGWFKVTGQLLLLSVENRYCALKCVSEYQKFVKWTSNRIVYFYSYAH